MKHYMYAGVATLHNGYSTEVDYSNHPLETDAVSPAKAAANIKFQIRKKLHTASTLPISLDLECLYCVDDIEDEIWQAMLHTNPTCAECGSLLTDGGYCPHCDDGDNLITV